jgi:hypothetical protein
MECEIFCRLGLIAACATLYIVLIAIALAVLGAFTRRNDPPK